MKEKGRKEKKSFTDRPMTDDIMTVVAGRSLTNTHIMSMVYGTGTVSRFGIE